MRSKKAFYNLISSIFLQIITIICGLILPKMIIKNYGSDVNGLISSITQFLSYIALLESGFGPVVKSLLYKPIANKNKKELENILYSTNVYFKRIAKIFFVYIIILCFIYPSIINNEFEPFFTISLIVIISVSTLFQYFFGTTYSLFLTASQENYVSSIIFSIAYILNLIVSIILINNNMSIHIVKLSGALIFLCRPILQNIYVKRKYKINYNEINKNYKIEQKWDGLTQHIAAVIHSNTDVVLLTIMRGVKEVSVYSVYNLILTAINRFIESIASSFESAFGDMIAKNEKNKLLKDFSLFEELYFTILTIAFSCCLVLIIPFVKVYMSGITDVNYIRPSFAFVFVLAEYIYLIRIPYQKITYSAGYFKQTKVGSILECIVNLSLSILLIPFLGMAGAAIGTMIAMTIRTFEFISFSTKNILEIRIKKTLKKVFLSFIEIIIIILISSLFDLTIITNYYLFFIKAIVILIISIICTLLPNCIVFRSEFNDVVLYLKKIIKNKNRGRRI